MKKRIRIIQEFEDKLNSQTYLVGEVFLAPEEFAKRFVLRGNAEFVNGKKEVLFFENSKVSIIILVKDALEYVKKCIESLLGHTKDFELIIIDNGSSSETKKYLAGISYSDYTLITNPENKGVGYGWNQGIKAAKYDYICFLNSDTLLSPNWLDKLMRGFKYSPDVGIVGPSTCHSATIQSPQVFKAFRNADQDKVNTIAATLKEDYTETPVVGFCFVVARKVFDKIGAFDYKRYGIACGEDMDFVWRAIKAGFKSVWCKDSYVHHFGNCTTKEMGLNPHEMRVKNTPILNKRMVDTANLYIENDVKIPKSKQINVGKTIVVMATLDRGKSTVKTLDSLFKNKNIEVIIVDNNSEDLEYLKDYKVKLIKNFSNVGVTKAINQGLEIADSKYIVIIHNDVTVTPGWIEKAVEFMESHKDVGVIGTSGWTEIDNNGSHNNIVSGIAKYNYKFKSDFVEVAVTDGQCNIIRNIGIRLDENYGFMHFYDKDLSLQYRKLGYKVYVIKAKVMHKPIPSAGSTIKNKKYKDKIDNSRLLKENRAKFVSKWKGIIPVKIMDKELIPILMTTYNRLSYTQKALPALLKSVEDNPCEIFVFDNNSTDGTQEYLRSIKDNRVTVYFNKENAGAVRAKNVFFEKYKYSKYVAFVDNDSIMPKGWINDLKAIMDKYPLIAVQLEHYVGLGWKFKDNMEWFKHLYRIEFKGHNLYLNNFVGGSGELVRRKYITGPVPEEKGTLSSWGHYLHERFNSDNLVSGFYDGLFMELLDMAGTNKKIYDFPGYREELKNLGRVDFGWAEFTEDDKKRYIRLRDKIDSIVKNWQ